MVWPTSCDGVAIAGNVRSNAHEGQPQRYQFMKGVTAIRVLRSEMDMRELATAEAQYPRNFLNASLHPRQGATMSHPAWQGLYNAAFLEVDLAKLAQRVEAACQAIHHHRVQKGHTLTAEEHKALDDALRVLFTLMRRRA